MAARKGSTPRPRHDYRSAPPDVAEIPEHVREFQRGLFPILLAGDVDAFRGYLTRWEEIIGDTADLGELPLDDQRTLMTRLLRHPQTYNLPAWPADLADAVDAAPIEFPPLRAPAPAAPEPQPEPVSTGEPVRASYQLDMITGELVPVAVEPPRVTEAAAGYEPMPGPPAKSRPRRRRRAPANLVQLAFWPEEPSRS